MPRTLGSRSAATAAATLVALVLLLGVCSDAFIIVSEVDAIVYDNGVAVSGADIRTECESQDRGTVQVFNQIKTDGTLKVYTRNCNNHDHQFVLDFYAYVFRDGALFRSKVFVTQNPTSFITGTTSGALYPPSPITERQLLGRPDLFCGTGHADCHNTGNFLYPGVAIEEEESNFGIHHDDLAAANCMVPVITGSINADVDDSGNSSYNCLNTVTVSTLSALEQNATIANASLYAYATSFKQIQDQNLIIEGNFTKLNNEAALFLNHSQQIIATDNLELTRQNQLDTQMQNLFLAGLRNNSKVLNAALATTSQLTGAIAQLALDSQNDTDRLQAQLASNVAAAQASLSRTYDIRISNKQFVYNNIRAELTTINTFYSVFKRMMLDQDMLEGQTQQFQRWFSPDNPHVSSEGFALSPFLEDMGIRSAANQMDLGPELSTMAKSKVILRAVVQQGPTIYGYEATAQLQCWSLFIIRAQMYQPTGPEIQKVVGPPGCVANYSLSVPATTRCLCYYSIVETRCPLLAGDTETWRIAQFDDPLRDAKCQSAPATFAGAYTGVEAVVSKDYLLFVSRFGGRPTYQSSDYHGTSILGQCQSFRIAYDPSVGDPTTYAALLQSDGGSSLGIGTTSAGQDKTNLIFWLNQAEVLSWNNAYDNEQFYRANILGLPPSYTDQDEIFFQRFNDGNVERGSKWSAMSFTLDQTLLVHRLTPGDTITTTSVTSEGVSIPVLDVQVTDTGDPYVPTTDVMVWSPDEKDTIVRNTADEDVLLDPYSPPRHHGVLYNAFGDKSQMTRDQFEVINQSPYVHAWGVNVPAIHDQPLDSNPASLTFGRCLTEDSAAAGDWCIRRRNYELIFSNGPFEDVNTPQRLTMRARNAYIQATIATVKGPLARNVIAACPSQGRTATTPSTITVEFTNNDATHDAIQFILSQVGACASGDETVTLSAGESIVRDYQRCSLAPPNSPDIVQVSYLSFDTTPASHVLCPEFVTLNYGLDTIRSFVGAASLGLVTTLIQFKVDTITPAILRSYDRTISDSTSLAIASLQSIYEVGFKVSDDTVAEYQTLLDQAADVQAQSTVESNEARANVVDPTTDLQDFDSDIQALNAQSAADFALLKQDIANTFAINAQEQLNLDRAAQFASTPQADLGNAVKVLLGWYGAVGEVAKDVTHAPFGADFNGDQKPAFDFGPEFMKRAGELGSDSLQAVSDSVGPFGVLAKALLPGGSLFGGLFGWVIDVLILGAIIFAAYIIFQYTRGACCPAYSKEDRDKIEEIYRMAGLGTATF